MLTILGEVAWRQRLQRQQGQSLRQLHTCLRQATAVLAMAGAKIHLPLLTGEFRVRAPLLLDS